MINYKGIVSEIEMKRSLSSFPLLSPPPSPSPRWFAAIYVGQPLHYRRHPPSQARPPSQAPRILRVGFRRLTVQYVVVRGLFREFNVNFFVRNPKWEMSVGYDNVTAAAGSNLIAEKLVATEVYLGDEFFS